MQPDRIVRALLAVIVLLLLKISFEGIPISNIARLITNQETQDVRIVGIRLPYSSTTGYSSSDRSRGYLPVRTDPAADFSVRLRGTPTVRLEVAPVKTVGGDEGLPVYVINMPMPY
jgi:hypothetical protein